MEKKRKRIGRPPKAPVAGERVSLGLRVTADIKRKLDEAATDTGRSQSQEAELRLEQSFMRGDDLVLAQGSAFTPVIFHGREMWVYVGDEEMVPIQMSSEDRKRLLKYLSHMRGEYTDEEIEEAGERYMQEQLDIERGR